MRSKLLTIAKVLVSLGLIVYVFGHVPLAAVGGQLGTARLAPLLLAFALYLTAMTLNAVKWQVLLRAQAIIIPFRALLRFQFIGFFFNNLPSATVAGDVMRGYGLARYTDRTADAAVSVIVDRIVGLTAYMATAAVAAVIASRVTGRGELAGIEIVAVIALLALAAILAVLLSRRLRGLISRVFAWPPLARLAPLWERTSEAFNCYRFRYAALAVAFGVALLGIGCTTLVNWFVSQSMGGLMPLLYILLFNPLIALVLMIPISIGGLGLSQNAYTSFFGLVGVPAGHALAVSLLMNLIQILASLPGGVLWLQIRRQGGAPAGGEALSGV